MSEHISVDHPANNVYRVVLNRPRRLNALARQTIRELNDAVSAFSESADSVLLLTGSGRAFCFGADFTEFEDRTQLPELLDMFQDLILKLYGCAKITMAVLNGFATGAGLDLALACDLRIASDRAKLGEGYVSMGLVCDGGGSFLLPRLVGYGRASHLLLTGEAVSAEDAKSMGMLNAVCSADELENQSLELAKSLCSKPQTALRKLKELIRRNAKEDFVSALRNEHEAQLLCFDDREHQQLIREFLNKRNRPS